MAERESGGQRRGQRRAAAPAASSPQADDPTEHVLGPRREQYLVAKRVGLQLFGAQPVDFDAVKRQLDADPEVELEPKTLRVESDVFNTLGISPPTGAIGGFLPFAAAAKPVEQQEVLVARMTPARADQLTANPALQVEPDAALVLMEPVTPPAEPLTPNLGTLVPFGTETKVRLRVLGKDDAPLPAAAVYVYGTSVPVQTATDDKGEATVSIREPLDTLRAVYVNPTTDHWSFWVPSPHLQDGEVNTIKVKPLEDSFPGFPQRETIGWGERAMRLDQLPPNMKGQGVRVAVVDSGAASATHEDLKQIGVGFDLTTSNDQTWQEDTVAHGTHCSGVIAGADNGRGVRGFAPGAEVHALKLFPGGHASSLLDALDYCIRNNIDVVNLSLGSDQPNEYVKQKILEAKRRGVACIVAAGNTSGPVQFPASIEQDVLTVSAIGRQGEFPSDSYHSVQAWREGKVTQEGYFAATFSCFGKEIDVCGPGVAIVSTVPPDSYAAWDGTSMATPHITGLAALVIAHHPDFKGPYQLRNEARVERLFQLLKGSAVPLDLGDPMRTGFGLPDAPRALGLEQPVQQPTVSGALSGPAAGVNPAQAVALALLLRAAAQRAALQQAAMQQAGFLRGPGFAPMGGIGVQGQVQPSSFGPAGFAPGPGPFGPAGFAPASAGPGGNGGGQGFQAQPPPGQPQSSQPAHPPELDRLRAALKAAGLLD